MTTPMPSPLPEPQPVDFIVAAAVVAGWPMEPAFECAMQLLLHGTTVTEARALFEQAARLRQ